MSLDATARRLDCDSSDCPEAVALPIVSSSDRMDGPRSRAQGWIFVAGTYEDRHYCPRCADRLLQRRAA